MIKFTIPLTPVTKKNSQRLIKVGNKIIPLPSKAYVDYEQQCGYFMPKVSTIDYPISVKCLFYMPTHRRCDLTNLLEAIDDCMIKHGIISDDNYNVIVSHDGSRVLYDKMHPRTELYIERYTNESKN